ncbi:MAG: HDOD domain-containing protein [Planctomycetota bacterium]|nr:HDOD domain-containing protein [Planctomycetota bacterium]
MTEKTDQSRILREIQRIPDLPTLPTVAQRINEAMQDPTTSAQDIGEIISHDPSLSAKTLKIVNSAFYGFPKQITSVTRSIVILGFNKVKSIALTTAIIGGLKRTSNNGFDFYQFWEHSLAVAIAAERSAHELGLKVEEDAFVAGLLHDIGKVVISQFLEKEFSEITELVIKDDLTMAQAEMEIMGVDHSRIGKWLAERWNFPQNIIVPIWRHHKPDLATEARELTHVVHLADLIVRALGIGSGGDNNMPKISESTWDHFYLNGDLLKQLCDSTLQGIEKGEAFFALIR